MQATRQLIKYLNRSNLVSKVMVATLLVLSLSVSPSPADAQSADVTQTDAANAGPHNSSLQTLLDVLKDDQARAQLIEELEASMPKAAEPAASADETVAEAVSVGRRIALITQEAGQVAASAISATWTKLSSGQSVFSGLQGDEFSILLKALPDLLLLIVITLFVFLSLRTVANRFYMRLGRHAARSGFVRTVSLFLVSNVADLFIVLFAWTLGYLSALLVVGELGVIGIRQSMYLNAFLIVEVAKAVVRSVLSPATGGLRLVHVSDTAATALYRVLSLIVSVLGYGQLLVVPILNRSTSMAAGSGVSALLSVFVLLYLVYVVMRRRHDVADWLSGQDDSRAQTETASAEGDTPVGETAPAQGFLVGLAKLWHWFALAYLGVMFVVVMTEPANVTFDALMASGKVLAALIVASLVSGWLSAAMVRGVSLSEDINQKLPLLEPRLNQFVPRAFALLRVAILFVVLLFALDVIGVVNMLGLLESQVGLQVTTSIVSVSVILLVAFGMWLALTSFVDFRLNPKYGSVPTSRETTLLTLMRNASTIALVIITIMFCLSEVGLNIGPLLASAGVLGLAIGFGAQSMVKDIITGVFIQFENAINVGDVITVGGVTGTVEKLSVRSVSLRDAHAVFHIIPFSSVDMVSNFMRGFSYTVCDMGIAYRENVGDAKQAMHDAFDQLMEDEAMAESVIAPLEWFGINSFGDSAVILRVRIKTVPGKQWAVGRAYNGHLKSIFDERGIEIPFPQQTIWLGEAKDGSTQPVRVENVSRVGNASAQMDQPSRPHTDLQD